MRHHLALIGASLLLAGTATADTLDVCQDGCTYSSIQDAINAASDGDRIEITKGLSAGDLIVAKAGAFVRDGDRIKPVVEGDPETTAAIAD